MAIMFFLLVSCENLETMRNTISAEATLARADLLMKQLGTDRIAVTEEDRIVGVVSKADIQRALEFAPHPAITPRTAEHFMTKLVEVVEIDPKEAEAHLSKLVHACRAQALILTDKNKPHAILLRDEMSDLIKSEHSPLGDTEHE